MSVIWDCIEKLEKMTTKLGTVKIGNYIDENKDILKEMGVDLEEEKKYESKRHLFSLLQFFKIISVFF